MYGLKAVPFEQSEFFRSLFLAPEVRSSDDQWRHGWLEKRTSAAKAALRTCDFRHG
jgi:hypothetical protein